MKIINKKTIISLVASLALSSSLFAQDKVYAVVNGENITAATIAVALRDPRVQFESLQKEQQTQVLNNIIEQKILAQEAFKSDVVKSALYKEELEKVKQNLAYQIWIRDLSKTVTVDDKEVKAYYDNNKAKFQTPLELKASHILVKTEKEAKDIIKTLSASKDLKTDFPKLAQEKSTGPSAQNGGDLGWFTKEKMLPEFSEAASALKVGTITKKAVQTQYGFHIIYLSDKKEPSIVAFDKIEKQLKQEVLQRKFVEKVQKMATDLKKKSKIEYK
ncbi:MAG: peptidylprolyl isomerase [Arcobacteraceae bacterium]